MAKRRLRPSAPRLRSLAVAVASLLAGSAFANPSGPSVVAGSASITSSGNTLTVSNAPGTIINWQAFSIGRDEVTRFVQQGASSAVLNRVTGAESSAILGQLLSNGRVFLINPNGVTIGAGARIDVAGFVASSLNLSNEDFLAGRLRFTDPGTGARVENRGTISTAAGGQVYLVAPTVENHGVISAPNGDVVLAAGRSVELVSSHSPDIRVQVQAGERALNVGEIAGRNIGIYGGLVVNSGQVSASGASVDEAGNIVLRATGDVQLEAGSTLKAAAGANGGAIAIQADRVVQSGAIDASGASGGSVSIDAGTVLQSARVDASGTAGGGGSISVKSSGSLVQTAAAQLDASGATGGGSITVQGTGERRVFSSATLTADSSAGAGGEVRVLGNDIVLAGATIGASGATGGGTVLVGGDLHGANPEVPNAQFVKVNGTTTIAADATAAGDGGKVVLWSDGTTKFSGRITARGGPQGGDGGMVEVSGKESVAVAGLVDASAPKGAPGTLLVDPRDIVIDAGAATGNPFIELEDPNPGAGEYFASSYAVVGPGYVVASDPQDQGGIGAAYFFDARTGSPTQGQLLNSIVGSVAGDNVGSGIAVLSSGNFIVRSQGWSNGAGALTFGRAGNGFAAGGGVVGAANSLVGSNPGDNVGNAVIRDNLPNGRFAVSSTSWNGNRGAITFGDTADGLPVGAVSNANSIVGTTANDYVGGAGLVALAGGSAAVVIGSPDWNASRGAATFVPLGGPVSTPGDGTIAPIAGTFGDVSAANSLIGAQPNQFVSSGGIVALSNGNYVVLSPSYSGAGGTETNAGAVTWGSGAVGVTGPVSVANSIRGNVGDQVGLNGITELYGAGAGNFVIASPNWNGGRGAVTWVDGSNGFASGATGPGGFVTAANSLTGTATTDAVGSHFAAINPLSNGNYVLLSPTVGNDAGAATLVSGVGGGGGQPIVNGVTQPIAPVGPGNSLVGSATGDFTSAQVMEHVGAAGSFYALFTTNWGAGRGAVTLSPSGGAGAGPVGPISGTTSIVGTTPDGGPLPGDRVGSGGLFNLYATNGKFVLLSPEWGPNTGVRGAGAITLIDSANLAAARGAVSPTAGAGLIVSLVGSAAGDRIGSGSTYAAGPVWLSGGFFAIHSPNWNGGAGAVTFVDDASAATKLAGTLSSTNSLVGASAGDRVGTFECDGTCSGIVDMLNGTYLVRSPGWTNTATSAARAGAVTLVDPVTGSASGPLSNGTGVVGTNNSIHGTTAQDGVGGRTSYYGAVRLDADRFAIVSPDWNNAGAGIASAGAVTFGSVSAWAPGPVTAANSLIGTHANDRVGSGGIQQSSSAPGVFGITSFEWNQSAGAVTFFDAASPPAGQSVSAANSLVGGAANDTVGGNGWFDVGGGKALVLSAQWGGGAGAATVVDLTGPSRSGVVTTANSFTGNANDQVGSGGPHFLPNGNFLVISPNANGGAGAVTFMTRTATRAGETLSSANSLVGTPPYGNLGSYPYGIDIRTLGNGDYIVVNPSYGPNGEGMIVYGSATTGVVGAPSPANGWVGTAQFEALGSFVTNLPGSTNQFVFNAPGATKNALQAAGRLFIANPGGLGAPAYPLTGDVNFGDVPGTDITINPSQITAITNTGTQLALHASNDIVLKAGSDIVTAPVSGPGGELRLSAGRSILIGSSIVTGDGNLQLVANATAADGVVDADRLPGAAEIRMAAGTSIDAGSGNVTMRIGDGAGLTNNTAGGITLGNVNGLVVDIQNFAANPTGDAARSITQLPGTGISAASLTMLAEGDIRLGGSSLAPAIATAGGAFLQSLGAIVAGGFTDVANQDATITLNGTSIGAAGAPVKLVVGQDVDATASAGGIHLEQVAGPAFTSSYNVAAPLGQTISLASSGGDLYIDDIVSHPGNVLIGKAVGPYRIQIGFDVAAQSLTLDAPGGIAVGNTAVALNAPGGITATGAIDVTGGTALTATGALSAPSVKLNPGATGTFNGPVTTSGFTVDGALATLNNASNLGALTLSGDTAALNLAAAATATSLAWTGTGSQTNTISGGSLTVSGPATIGGQGTRNLSGTNLVLNGASGYGAGTGAFNLLGTAAITNNGTFAIANDNPIAAPATSLNTFTNNGTLAKNAGTGTTTIGGPVGQIALVNNGTVQVNAGTLALANGGSGGGAYAVAPGATLAFTGGTHTLSGTSSVAGGGTLALAGPTTVVDVGGSYGVANTSVAAGTLKLQGPATGLQTVSVGGAGAVLNVNGTLDAQTLSVGGGSVDIAGSATVANLAETAGSVVGTGNLTVTSSYSRSGGTFGSGWNALSVTQTSGDLDTAGFGAVSQLALAAPAGVLRVTTPISTGASMALTGGAGVDVNASVDAGGALAVSSGGAVNVVNGALSSYGSTVSVSGASLAVNSGTILGGAGVSIAVSGPVTIQDGTIAAPSGVMNISAGSMTLAGGSTSTMVYAGSGFTANVGGDVVIAGGSASGASAEIYANGSFVMNVGGNLVLTGGSGDGAYASITGNPDLASLSAPLKVGGTITMTTGSGLDACAAIESVSKDSIYVFFPFLASGGYTVDGAAVTSNGISGFFAGGVPAILDQNLFIFYGLSQLTDAVGLSLQQTWVPFEQDFRTPENRDDLEGELAELDDEYIGACQ